MNTMPKSLALVIVAIGMLLPKLGISCSCVNTTYEELVDSADHIFVAQVTSAKYVPSNEEYEPGYVEAQFEAVEVLKGDPTNLQHLTGGLGGGDCGFPIMVGRHILVQTDESGGLSICGGTRVAYPGFEEWDAYLDGVKQYIESGEPITPFEGDEYGPTSHELERY